MIVRKIHYFQALMSSHSIHVMERNKEKRIRKLCYKQYVTKLLGNNSWKDFIAHKNAGNSVAGRATLPLSTVSVAMVFVTQTLRTAGLLWTLHSGPEGLSITCFQMYLLFIKHELTINENLTILILGMVSSLNLLLLHILLFPFMLHFIFEAIVFSAFWIFRCFYTIVFYVLQSICHTVLKLIF